MHTYYKLTYEITNNKQKMKHVIFFLSVLSLLLRQLCLDLDDFGLNLLLTKRTLQLCMIQVLGNTFEIATATE